MNKAGGLYQCQIPGSGVIIMYNKMLLPLGETGEGNIGSLYCFSQLHVNLQFVQKFLVFF